MRLVSLGGSFIVYRGYRGFFVILPSVFFAVQSKLLLAFDRDFRVFEDDDLGLSLNASYKYKNNKVLKKLATIRNTIFVSALASVVVAMYVARGLGGLCFSFLRIIKRDRNLFAGLLGASNEVLQNEKRMQTIAGNGVGVG